MAQATFTSHSKVTPPGKMSFDEFIDWAGPDIDAEWVDGEVVWMSPVSLDAGDVSQFLGTLVRHYVEYHDLGNVYCERVLMRLRSRPSGREPDVLFVAKGRRSILKKKYVDGAADLAIEVICEESRTRDRVEKFQEYAHAGVREYWIIDPDNETAELYQLDDNGNYKLIPASDSGVYHSAVLIGLWLKPAWLWQKPLPPLLSVLREWQIV